MAGFAIRTRFAGHPDHSSKTSYPIGLIPVHPIGAGHLTCDCSTAPHKACHAPTQDGHSSHKSNQRLRTFTKQWPCTAQFPAANVVANGHFMETIVPQGVDSGLRMGALGHWTPTPGPLWPYHQDRRNTPAALQAFIVLAGVGRRSGRAGRDHG